MDIENILSKALGIANNKKFTVRIYEGIEIKIKELTYLQLGTFLITNAEGIDSIRIHLKE